MKKMITIEDINDFFDISQKLEEGGEIKCKYCEEWIRFDKWEETYIECEICPDGHLAIICPECSDVYDCINSRKIETRNNPSNEKTNQNTKAIQSGICQV